MNNGLRGAFPEGDPFATAVLIKTRIKYPMQISLTTTKMRGVGPGIFSVRQRIR